MSAHQERRSHRKGNADDRRNSDRGSSDSRAQSLPGANPPATGRTDFQPPRSRTPTSSRQTHQTLRPESRGVTESNVPTRGPSVRWSQETSDGSRDMPSIFSPPRARQSTASVAKDPHNAPGTMEMRDNQPQHLRDQFAVDLEGNDDPFPPDVFNLPVGSFNEDSPPRGHSSDGDERRRRHSPRGSPIVRQPPMPLYQEIARDKFEYFPNIGSPSPRSRQGHGPPSQYAYYPSDPTDWFSPPPIEHPGAHLGQTPQRSPIQISSPDKRGAEYYQHQQATTPSRPAPFPFEASPRAGYENLINTPKGTPTDDFMLVGYEGTPILPDRSPDRKMDFSAGVAERNPAVSHHQPERSPLSGFLMDFAPSPPSHMSGVSRSPLRSDRGRASGPYGRHQYTPAAPYDYALPPGVPPTALKASPVVSERRGPRKLWHDSSKGPSTISSTSNTGMRVELGSSAKALEGINQMMRAQTTAAAGAGAHRMPPHHHGRYPYHPHYPPPLHHHQGHPSMPPPPYHSRPHHTPIKASAPGMKGVDPSRYPFASAETPSGPATAKRAPASRKDDADVLPKPKGAATEKNTSQVTATGKRNPCNCKKSRCLKLYCECFASEQFCDGCNCTACQNNERHQDIRDRAMKETKSKNPKAFQPRLAHSEDPAQSNHTMGCRCKKSECLKKYCECFQAGVFCAGKCKCKQCANYAGSQKLIDKRRKMKDVRGTQIALRAADEAWKAPSARKPPGFQGAPLSTTPGSVRKASTPGSVKRSPEQIPRGSATRLAPRPHYMGPHYNYRMPQMSYSPLAVPTVTPGYSGPSSYPHPPPQPPSSAPQSKSKGTKRDLSEITPSASASAPPRTPAVRLNFDPSSSRKKRKKGDQDEATFPYFGAKVPEQPKTAALAVFSFLSNEDVYKAALVSKTWRSLAEDGELWQFP